MESEIKQLLEAASLSDDAVVREAVERVKARFQMWALTENCIVFLRRRDQHEDRGTWIEGGR